jgi:hypothetical protein
MDEFRENFSIISKKSQFLWLTLSVMPQARQTQPVEAGWKPAPTDCVVRTIPW